MKKLMTIAFVFLLVQSQAQNFEGTVKWSMKMEITDPELKAKMAAGQQKMQDPANQAKMKELQDKMNDPQFKAMMEKNPQMKAMMEKMTQGAQSGDMMGSMIPKGMTIKMKGGNTLVTMEGGMMAGDFLHTADKSYMLNREAKTYSVMPHHDENGKTSDMKPTVTKTSETTTIMGYKCTKYVVTMSEHGQTVTSNVWTTTDIKDFDLKALSRQRMGRGQSLMAEGVDGVPLRIESTLPQGKMTMEVTDIKKESLDASLFTVPSDYKETQGFMGGMR